MSIILKTAKTHRGPKSGVNWTDETSGVDCHYNASTDSIFLNTTITVSTGESAVGIELDRDAIAQLLNIIVKGFPALAPELATSAALAAKKLADELVQLRAEK